MAPDLRRRLAVLFLTVFPIGIWLVTVSHLYGISLRVLNWRIIGQMIRATPQHPYLYGPFLFGIGIAFILIVLINRRHRTTGFDGEAFKRFIRGTQVVSSEQLARKCKAWWWQSKQVIVGGIPWPLNLETLHLLICGATGTGKSVLLRFLVYTALLRGDRMAIVDPNGDMLSKFYKPGDTILNPYDQRSAHWVFYNEIRSDYDYKRLSRSIVPMSEDKGSEEWNDYGRLLVRETAKKLHAHGSTSIEELFKWCTIAPAEDLRLFLTGTLAESLFAGSSEASKALASARFVLSNKLSEHMNMPHGDFSIRDWMADPNGGNLFITWREDMAPAMRPLVSTWVDVILTTILSMPESKKRRFWLFIDELDSLDALSSLKDGLTKGRKHGLRIVAGLQTTSQLAHTYGQLVAQTIRASFRNLVVLAGSKTDPQTAEDMSKSLGDHEVLRYEHSESRSVGNRNTSSAPKRVTERVVTASEIPNFPALTGYIAFSEKLPIAKIVLEPQNFVEHTPAFIEAAVNQPFGYSYQHSTQQGTS